MNLFRPSIRLMVASTVLAGSAVATAGIAAAEADCSSASPSDTTCQPPASIPPVVEGEQETKVLAETAVAPATAAAPAPAVKAAAAKPVAAESLAFTGSDSAELALLGAGAIALGVGATVASRRRSKS